MPEISLGAASSSDNFTETSLPLSTPAASLTLAAPADPAAKTSVSEVLPVTDAALAQLAPPQPTRTDAPEATLVSKPAKRSVRPSWHACMPRGSRPSTCAY